jgi:hypothetical protein
MYSVEASVHACGPDFKVDRSRPPLATTRLVPFEATIFEREPEPRMHNLHSGLVYWMAREQALSIPVSEYTKDHGAAIPAVLLAAASLEAFLNESALLAALATKRSPEPRFAALHHYITEGATTGNTAELCYMARYVLTGTPFDRGAEPFQGLDLLISIRNHIAHLKPSRAGAGKSIRGGLASRGILHECGPTRVHG